MDGNNVSLTYFGKLMAADGYGRATELNIKSLLDLNVNVFVRPTGDWSPVDTDETVFSLQDRSRRPTRWGILHHWPPTDWGIGDCRWHLGYTMIEGTRAPSWYVRAVNRHSVAVMVPSNFCLEALQQSGVTRPIFVVPHGLDNKYYFGNLRAERPVTFGILGTLTPRKGVDVLLRAWNNAFPKGTEEVRLEIKHRGEIPDLWKPKLLDNRISVLTGDWDVQRTRRWYQGITCYVSPTRGEGFGLTLCEAMLCGCAVIGTDWSGCAEFLDSSYSYPLSITGLRRTIVDWPAGPDFGEWAIPNENQLTEILREIALNQDRACAKGRIASAIIREKYPLQLPGAGIVNIIREYMLS